LEFPDDHVGDTVYGVRLEWGDPKRLAVRDEYAWLSFSAFKIAVWWHHWKQKETTY
jgi:hypothetical protein